MANLKNITELPVAESADGLNLIVNDNGSAKQIAASAVGAQADWAQNDTNAPDYVKNRTHYVEEEVILERQTIDGFTALDGGYGVLLSYIIDFPDGELTIYWDGAEYDCVANNGFVGNALITGGADNGIPFIIIKEANGGVSGIAVMNGSASTSHTVGIVKKTYHKLDAKYLPVEEWDLDLTIDITWNAETSTPNDAVFTAAEGYSYDAFVAKFEAGEIPKVKYQLNYSLSETTMFVSSGKNVEVAKFLDNQTVAGYLISVWFAVDSMHVPIGLFSDGTFG